MLLAQIPGLFAVLVFHFPTGGWYLYYIVTHHLASMTDWIIVSVYFVIAVYVLIIKGNMWLKDIHSPFNFSDKQMGPYLTKLLHKQKVGPSRVNCTLYNGHF
ncbi:hypothetical protein [Paenibacillus sp. QZ-Y1]|uniref:hypothetical protein n=1 Tax=Paenibacillus sp. QZ-Y1 TaxID=3414511 RepID=UPI003F793831